jgi:hypothetical protein
MVRVLNRRRGERTPGAVYVGRPTRWGNPFVVGSRYTQQQAVDAYRAWVVTQPELLAAAKAELAGHDLICWCHPLPCHADVLVEIANEKEA